MKYSGEAGGSLVGIELHFVLNHVGPRGFETVF